jgi:glycosyltransferase involved in cell wall biosynthesis
MPLVSVVMPSYNHEEFIAESIESVLGQDFDDFELIIVDDASTDSSRQIIQKYAAEDSRIRVILHEANCGIAKTANDGIEAAKGKFIANTASDDVWARDKLTKQLAVIASNENLIVWSEGEVIDRKGQPVGKSFSELHRTVSRKKSGDIFQELLKINSIFGSTLLFKKTNLGEIRFDESLMYLNDHKFALDLAREYEFYYIAEPLAQYRVHGKNTLGGSDPKVAKRRRRAHREWITINEGILRQCSHKLSDANKASIYAATGYSHEFLGENAKAFRSFSQAITHNPFHTRNLRFAFRLAKIALLNVPTSRIKNRRSSALKQEKAESDN